MAASTAGTMIAAISGHLEVPQEHQQHQHGQARRRSAPRPARSSAEATISWLWSYQLATLTSGGQAGLKLAEAALDVPGDLHGVAVGLLVDLEDAPRRGRRRSRGTTAGSASSYTVATSLQPHDAVGVGLQHGRGDLRRGPRSSCWPPPGRVCSGLPCAPRPSGRWRRTGRSLTSASARPYEASLAGSTSTRILLLAAAQHVDLGHAGDRRQDRTHLVLRQVAQLHAATRVSLVRL